MGVRIQVARISGQGCSLAVAFKINQKNPKFSRFLHEVACYRASRLQAGYGSCHLMLISDSSESRATSNLL